MNNLLLFVIFSLFVFTVLTLTRLLHLLNTLFDHRSKHASLSRGVYPSGSLPATQWDALQPDAHPSHSVRARRMLVILGSGGHTGEMLQLLRHVDRSRCADIVYVRAATDVSSEVRVRQMEEEKRNAHKCRYVSIHRSREVGQSYASSVPSTLLSIAQSVAVVYQHRPDIVSRTTHSSSSATAKQCAVERVESIADCATSSG